MASGDQEWESKCRSRGATTNLFAGVREPLHKANPQQLRSTWQLTHSYLERCEQAWRRRTPTIRQLEEQQIVSRPLLVDDGDRLVFVGQTLTRPISQHGFDELLESGIDDNRNVYTLQVHKLDNSFGKTEGELLLKHVKMSEFPTTEFRSTLYATPAVTR